MWRHKRPTGAWAKMSPDGKTWHVGISGPENTPWEKYDLCIKVDFKPTHPKDPPECQSEPALFHPNCLNLNGHLCYDLLNSSGWSEEITLAQLLASIRSHYLTHPNLDSAYGNDAARILREQGQAAWEAEVRNRAEAHNAKVKEILKE